MVGPFLTKTYNMKKSYLDIDAKKDDIIRFKMPPFCSGEYLALVEEDKRGIYINKDDNFFKGCRDYEIVRPTDFLYKDLKLIITKNT